MGMLRYLVTGLLWDSRENAYWVPDGYTASIQYSIAKEMVTHSNILAWEIP